jgi:hypothetical protein
MNSTKGRDKLKDEEKVSIKRSSSVLPHVDESFEDWCLRIMKMVQEKK